MTLSDWRKREGLSLRAAAERIGKYGGESISHQMVKLLEAGAHSPTIATADLIKRGTGGAVTRMDWPEAPATNGGGP